jgi:hypothetical protein
MLLDQRADSRLAVGRGQQEHLAGDELVTALGGFLFSSLQQGAEVAAGLHLFATLHLRQLLQFGFERGLQFGGVDAGASQQSLRSVGLRKHRREHVHGLHVRVVAAVGEALGIGQRFLKSRREFVETHGKVLLFPAI